MKDEEMDSKIKAEKLTKLLPQIVYFETSKQRQNAKFYNNYVANYFDEF